MNMSAELAQFLFVLARRLFVLSCVVSALVSLSLSSLTSEAQQLSQTYSVDYALGDNDSHASAREIALHQIRMKAIEHAGKYVQGDEQLNQEQLTQNIRIVGATVVSISQIHERYSIGAHNQTVLHLEAKASINDAQLKKRILAIQADAEQRRRLKQYEHDLDAIIQHVKRLSTQKTLNQEAIDAIISERDMLLLNLHATLKAVKLEFKQGFILEKARETDLAIRNKADMTIRELYNPIVDLTKVTLSTTDVSFNEASGLYDYIVDVQWEIPFLTQSLYDKVKSSIGESVLTYSNFALCPYCGGLGSDGITYPYNGLSIAAFNHEITGLPTTLLFNPYSTHESQRLIKLLSKHAISIDVFMQGIKHPHKSHPISTKLITDSHSHHGYIVFLSGHKTITFQLTKAEAERASGVAATVKLLHP